MSKKKNLNSIEYLRAFSMLYIVGYWHMFNYTDAFPQYHNPITHEITFIVLGLFVVISGFLIGRTANKSPSPIDFYRKRLARIYPLYAFAVIIFYIYGLNDIQTSAKSLLLISMYYGPAPVTLWFITMLFLFYLITPFLLKRVTNPIKYFFVIAAIFLATLAVKVTFKTVDLRVLLYFPCFCIGLYCSQHGLTSQLVNIRSALTLLCFGLILLFIDFDLYTANKLKHIPFILSCTYLILVLSANNENFFKQSKIISLLSYSSFAMYLFHRPIYISLKSLYFPESNLAQVLYLTTMCLLIITLLSWTLQRLYDRSCTTMIRPH